MGRSTPKGVSPYRDKTPAPVPGPQPGNLYGLAHGAFANQLVIPEADALAVQVMKHVPHLADRDTAAVRDYCIAQIRTWRLAAYLERVGDFDSKGRLRPAVEALRKWLSKAEAARSRLGLDPVSYASLNVDKAQTARIALELAREDLEEGRRLVELAERRELGAGDGG